MTDIHYDLRASERGAHATIEDVLTYGRPVERRRKFFNRKDQVAYCYNDFVHIFTYLKKRITVVPFSKRKWKFI